MKNVLYMALALTVMACNSDDEDREVCVNRVWSIDENCPEGDTECVYIATFGETAATAGSVITNEATYDYYTALGNTTDGSVCWEGTKE